MIKRRTKNATWSYVKALTGRELYDKIRATYNLGYWPNTTQPSTFNEKIISAKLQKSRRYLSSLADKYEVRQFVMKKVGLNILNDVYYTGDSADEIPFNDMPDKFVVKTTHGSGGVFIVHDKHTHDLSDLVEKVNASLKESFGDLTNEQWYLDVKPRVIVEELLEDKKVGIPYDYKFFCFHGKCHFIQVDMDRFQSHSRRFYDRDWNAQEFSLLFPLGKVIEKPSNLDDMIKVAEALSEGIDFIRVDLYTVNGGIRFGEMTYAPGAGWEPFHPKRYDKELGKLWSYKGD